MEIKRKQLKPLKTEISKHVNIATQKNFITENTNFFFQLMKGNFYKHHDSLKPINAINKFIQKCITYALNESNRITKLTGILQFFYWFRPFVDLYIFPKLHLFQPKAPGLPPHINWARGILVAELKDEQLN